MGAFTRPDAAVRLADDALNGTTRTEPVVRAGMGVVRADHIEFTETPEALEWRADIPAQPAQHVPPHRTYQVGPDRSEYANPVITRQ
jgi:hypothetical protein